MNAHFHPDYDDLLEFSAGVIAPSVGLCISVHLEYCEQCRQQLAKLDAIGGLMFEQLEPAAVDDSLLDSIFDRIDSKASSSAGRVQMATERDHIPHSVKKLVGYDLEQLKWRRHGSKVHSAILLNDNGINASLIRIQAGASVPQHDHRGREYTVILQGSFSDDSGVYREGDFVLRQPGQPHSPTATADRDCLCLAVLDAPMRFRNPLYELVNRINPL